MVIIMGKRITYQDIADRVGVSKSTVSLAFCDSKKLSDQTVAKVMAAAQELGYSQDPAARMLRTRRTNSIGILLPQQLDRVLENPYYSLFLQGVGSVCQREGLTLLLVPPLKGSMLKAIPYAAVDGFIVCGLEEDRGEVLALRQRGVPTVMVDGEDHDGFSSIGVRESDGTSQLMRYLLRLGHRRFAFVAIQTDKGDDVSTWRGSVRKRIDAIAAVLSEEGLALDSPGISVLQVPCTREGGASAFDRVWAADKPTAIVAFSDIIALGVLDAAHRSGVSVPGHVSVSGFDDIGDAASARPSLTTVHQPIASKGRLAAEFLVDEMARTEREVRRESLEASLLVRESTGPVRLAGQAASLSR